MSFKKQETTQYFNGQFFQSKRPLTFQEHFTAKERWRLEMDPTKKKDNHDLSAINDKD